MSIEHLQNLLVNANRDKSRLLDRLSAYEDMDELCGELMTAIRLIKTEAEEYIDPEEALRNIELTCIALLSDPKL